MVFQPKQIQVNGRRLPLTQRCKQLNVRLPQPLWSLLRKLTRQRQQSQSEVICQAIASLASESARPI